MGEPPPTIPHSQVLPEPRLSPLGDRTGESTALHTGKSDTLGLLFTPKAREGYSGRVLEASNGKAKLLNSVAVGCGPCCWTQENKQKRKKETKKKVCSRNQVFRLKDQAHRTKSPT